MTISINKIESKSAKLNRLSKEYIINSINGDGYEVDLKTTEDKLRFLWKVFNKEYGYMINRIGPYKAMQEWIAGLPSVFNIDFENAKIIEIAVEWESLPVNYSDKQAEKILNNWFNLISVKTFQLFKKYKVC